MGTTSSKSVGTLKPAVSNSAYAQPTQQPVSPDASSDFRQPLVVIEPRRTIDWADVREVWVYRELLYFLVWRDLKVRYKQTAVGVAWVVLQPILTTLIFSVFLGKLARVPSDGFPYAIFVFAGLLPWTFLSGAIHSSGNSLVGSAHLITKVYFPRILIPLAAVGARLFDFLISFAVLVGMMVIYRVAPTVNLLMLLPLIVLVTLLTLAIGLLASATNVRYRDVGVLLPVLVQLWMFASPVIYPLTLVPQRWKTLFALNPLVGIITGFRSAVLGLKFEWTPIAVSAVITIVLSALAVIMFRRMERFFADIV
ncbi:MAG TPA: ABC transporter permease [Pyrinomonadaceae bacterium]|nr:ABC transporter permease [Pyrinomonadaceae bacterium]